MKLKELLAILNSEAITYPERLEQEVFVYMVEEPVDGLESPTPITLIDCSISDRIDINC